MTYNNLLPLITVGCVLLGLPGVCQAASGRDTAASWALHVLEGQRYFEAAHAANQLIAIAPEDAGAFEVRGAIALHVGDITQATHDFREAQIHAGHVDPLAAYGLGLCDLYRKDYTEAGDDLARADEEADDTHQPEVKLAQAVLDAARGNADAAIQSAASLDTPAAVELVAVATYHISPANGLPLLNSFLSHSEKDSVPVVAEPAGLRLLGAVGSGVPLEPAVTEPALAADFARTLSQESSRAPRNALRGTVSLTPPAGLDLGGSSSAMISVSADGHLVGMINAAPYSFSWDTTAVANGPHLLVWTAQDSAGGMTSQRQAVYVLNKEAPAERSQPLPDAMQARIWKLLIIHPAYKVAEYLLAQADAKAGHAEQANDHYLRAAALDPTYKDVGARVADLFHGDAPMKFPLPADVRIPKTGSIAGENHSNGIWIGNPKKWEIALTFDDGPSANGTPPLLDALHAAHAPGTFFVVGMRAALAPDLVRRMTAEGDDVEDHSYSHPNLDEALPDHIREEVLRGAVIDRSLSGRWPAFFRPPGGDANPLVLKVAQECGMSGAFWTVDALSAEDTGSPAAVTKWVVSHARPGAIMLMHDGTPCTTAAIPAMVQELRSRGYKLVTLRQLAHDALQ